MRAGNGKAGHPARAAAIMGHASAVAGHPTRGDRSMASPIRYQNPPTLATPSGFSHVTDAPAGRIVFVSGQVAYDSQGHIVGAGDIAAQTRQVLRNVGSALEAAGSDFRHVLKFTFFVRDMRPDSIAKIREVRKEFLDESRLPASTMVGVTALAREELLLEVEAYAVTRGHD
jgi:enamine deaminase RidA (YjgF/YER057c/UK114 family)